MASTSSLSSDAARAAGCLRDADYLFIGAGAGCSAESGIDTFAALKAAGIDYDTIASLDGFCRDFDLFCGFWIKSQRAFEKASPHDGYSILSKWSKHVNARQVSEKTEASADDLPSQRTFVCTSNVDGFFERAGFDVDNISEIHGSARRWQCGGVPNRKPPFFPNFHRPKCSNDLFAPPEVLKSSTVDSALRASPPPRAFAPPGSSWPPRCPRCGAGDLRPNVYLFGDGTNFADTAVAITRARQAAWIESVLAKQRKAAASGQRVPRLVILEIGCGLRVPSIRRRCEELHAASLAAGGEESGASTFVRINPEYPSSTLVPGGDPTIPMKGSALQALQEIEKHLVSGFG